MAQPDDLPERGLRDHLGILRRRAPIIIGITALAVMVALVFSWSQPTRYRASADVLYQQEPASTRDPSLDQIVESKRLDANRVMQDQVRVATGEEVRKRAHELLGGEASASASNVRDSDVIVITGTADSASRAADVANTWASAYVAVSREQLERRSSAGIDAVNQELDKVDSRLAAIDTALIDPATVEPNRSALTGERDALRTQRGDWVHQRSVIEADATLATENEVEIIDPASPPASPSQPATTRNAVLALIVGLGLALVVAYAVDQIDDVLRSVDDLERASGLSNLATIEGDETRDVLKASRPDDPVLPVEVREAIPHDGAVDARVLVVPRRSRAHRVRQHLATLERLGTTVIGTVLVVPCPTAGQTDEPSPEPARDPVT